MRPSSCNEARRSFLYAQVTTRLIRWWRAGETVFARPRYLPAMVTAACRVRVSISVLAADRRRLETIVADRHMPQKHVWRARIMLLSADGAGTNAIMAATSTAKTTVWRWHARFMEEGVNGLLRDKPARYGADPG